MFKRIDVLTLIITAITLCLMLFVAWKVSQVVDHVQVAITKIESSVINPITKAENQAENLIEKEVEKGLRKLEGK